MKPGCRASLCECHRRTHLPCYALGRVHAPRGDGTREPPSAVHGPLTSADAPPEGEGTLGIARIGAIPGVIRYPDGMGSVRDHRSLAAFR